MNTLYDDIRQQFLRGQVDWNAVDIRMMLVTGDYVFDPSHTNITAIAPAERVADADVPNESSNNGFAFGDQTAFLSLSSPEPVTAVVLYVNTGVEATSSLIAYYDEVIGFPFTPTGLDYFISPDIVFGGFFRL